MCAQAALNARVVISDGLDHFALTLPVSVQGYSRYNIGNNIIKNTIEKCFGAFDQTLAEICREQIIIQIANLATTICQNGDNTRKLFLSHRRIQTNSILKKGKIQRTSSGNKSFKPDRAKPPELQPTCPPNRTCGGSLCSEQCIKLL